MTNSRGRAQVPWPRERLKLGLPESGQVVDTLAGAELNSLAAARP